MCYQLQWNTFYFGMYQQGNFRGRRLCIDNKIKVIFYTPAFVTFIVNFYPCRTDQRKYQKV